MTEPFLGEVRMLSFNYAPKGWATCDGQLMPINQNQALFALLGTTFGGDGRTNFALPDMRGRTAIHDGDQFMLGQSGGQPSHTLTIQETPTHTHELQGTTAAATQPVLTNALLAATASTDPIYQTGSPVAMEPTSIGNVGGSQPHDNMQPYLTINFSIALVGIFPSRN